jgi:hypothetical protein
MGKVRLYVNNYQITASHELSPIREIGSSRPVGVISTGMGFNLHCDFVPILDEGESYEDILRSLAKGSGNQHGESQARHAALLLLRGLDARR